MVKRFHLFLLVLSAVCAMVYGGILIYIGNNQSQEDEEDESHKVTSLASTIFYAGGVIILYALSNLLQALEDVLDILEESKETEERV